MPRFRTEKRNAVEKTRILKYVLGKFRATNCKRMPSVRSCVNKIVRCNFSYVSIEKCTQPHNVRYRNELSEMRQNHSNVT